MFRRFLARLGDMLMILVVGILCECAAISECIT